MYCVGSDTCVIMAFARIKKRKKKRMWQQQLASHPCIDNASVDFDNIIIVIKYL